MSPINLSNTNIKTCPMCNKGLKYVKPYRQHSYQRCFDCDFELALDVVVYKSIRFDYGFDGIEVSTKRGAGDILFIIPGNILSESDIERAVKLCLL